jgi:hypothetical protein
MKKKNLLTAFAIASVVLMAGCREDDFVEIIGVCPEVISTSPADDDANVPFNKIITASFNDVMDAATVTESSFTVTTESGIAIDGSVTYLDSTASFVPTQALTPNTTYIGYVSASLVKSLKGYYIKDDYEWTFSTGDIAPTVTLTDPLNLAIDVPLGKTVTATFSVPMTASTILTSFTLKTGGNLVAGVVSYASGIGSFNPDADLLEGTTYTATITTGAQNELGTSMTNKHEWTFRTEETTVPPAVILGQASIFGAFGGTAGVTNQGLNTIINNGGIGTTAVSTNVTGFHDGLTGDVYTETPLNVGNATGGIYTAPPAPGTEASFAIATQALADATIAYNSISPASKPGGIDLETAELGGLTLAPGIYKSASGSYDISNVDLTLDASNDPNAVWIFQAESALTVGIAGPAGARNVLLINGALPKNVYWFVGSAATINGAGGGTMVGTILAYSGVTFSTPGVAVQTVLNGRAISLVGSVTMVNTTINIP